MIFDEEIEAESLNKVRGDKINEETRKLEAEIGYDEDQDDDKDEEDEEEEVNEVKEVKEDTIPNAPIIVN